jgi:riboflavin synthase
MFAGIIEAKGRIDAAEKTAGNTRLAISAAQFGMGDVSIGDSIAVNGVCLTVVEKNARSFSFDVSQETLDCTVGFERGGEVNLERSLRFGGRVDGHLVSGHVDGVGRVSAMEDLGASWRLKILAPCELGRYVARKGSIAINGVSLTVNRVEDSASGCEFEVNIIPHTHSVTTLGLLTSGMKVNLEVDMMARYIERALSQSSEARDGK